MAKARAYGADATLKAAFEAAYGAAPASGYRSLDFKSTDLSSSVPLGDDPLLGRGRNSQDPFRGLVTDEGEVVIPFDLQGTGFWMTGLFGEPVSSTVAAAGTITFSANPTAGDTITLNGTEWEFVASGASGAQTDIESDLATTLAQLIIDLNGSADAEVAKCTYSVPEAGVLRIVFDTAGTTGNAFTIAASAATRSAPTLTGGGNQHVWESGAATLPSYTFEVGHPELTTPVFFRHLGCVLESLSFEMGQEGPANGTINVVAQGEESQATTLDASPDVYVLRRFSQGRGSIKRGGTQLAGVTTGRLAFSNTLERVRVIREDGKIEAADPTIATCEGSMTVRFNGSTLVAEAESGDPVALEYGFSFPEGFRLTFELPRVFLPKPKYSIAGPAGVEAVFDWRAAYDSGEGTMLRVTLINDVSSYAAP